MTPWWRLQKRRVLNVIDALVCLIRKLWRPLSLMGVMAGTWANIVYLPLKTGKPISLTEAAAWIAALGGLSWIREWGKVRGVKD